MADVPAPPETMGLREFADHMGWKASYITELKGKGHLVLTPDKRRIVVADTKRLLADLQDPAKAGVAARHAATRAAGKGQGAGGTQVAATAPDSAGSADASDAGDDDTQPVPDSPFARRRAEAQAKLAEAQARRAEREELVELGELLERAPTVAAIQKHLAALCNRLRSLPNTLAPALAAGDEARCRVLLGEEIEHALADVERKLKSIGREG